MGPVLLADAVTFAYGRTQILDCVNLTVDTGEFVALVGPNGSGKSTLIKVLLGLLRPDAGRVSVLGSPPQDLTERWRIGYVPQRPPALDLLPVTVAEVVASGRLARSGWWRRARAADRTAIDEALEVVALTEHARHPLAQLSGGQQQRALIAKALVAGPDLLVLDEPVAGVDVASQRRFRDALVSLTVVHRKAVLLVSHELGAVADDLDRLVVLRGGKVGFDGPPAELTATGVSLGVHAHDLPLWLEGL
jgi:zinc transport system ATP-binding protein